MVDTLFILLFTLCFVVVAWWKIDWAIVLCVLFVPTYLLRFQMWFVPMTILEVLVVVICAVWLLKYLVARSKKIPTEFHWPWPWLTILWVVAGVVAVIISPDTRQALGLWKSYIIEPVLFFIVFVNVVKTRSQIRSIIWALGALTVLVGFVTLVQYIGVIGIPDPYGLGDPVRATSVFPFPTAVGKLLGPLIALFLALALVRPRREAAEPTAGLWPLVFPWGVLAFGAMALLFSFSRAAMIGVFAGLVLVSFFSQWKKWLWLGLIVVIAVCLLVPFTRHEIISLVTASDTSADVHRVMWKGAVRIIEDNPVLGTGLASFPVVYEKYKEASHTEFFPNPDELYLTLWIEMGFFGLLVFIGIVVQFFITGFKKLAGLSPEFRAYIVGLLAAMVALLVHGFFDTPFFKNDLAIVFWVLVGLLVSIRNMRLPDKIIVQ